MTTVTMLERIVEYANPLPMVFPRGLRLQQIEVGRAVMQRLSRELLELSGVELGALPDRISYKGVLIVYDGATGTERIDAKWEDRYLTTAGKALAATDEGSKV